MSSLDFQAIGRILDAVSAAGGVIPDDLLLPVGDVSSIALAGKMKALRRKRTDLIIALSGAASWSRIHTDLHSDARAKARDATLKKVERTADVLAGLLASDPINNALAQYFPAGTEGPELSSIVSGLRRISVSTKQEMARLKKAGLDKHAPLSLLGNDDPVGSAGEEAILDLERIFRAHLKLEPRILQNADREPCGPFVEFVIAVRAEDGERCTAAAVKKSADRAKDLRASRDKGI